MKPIVRSAGLRPFSGDHHRSLVITRRVLRACAEGRADAALAVEVAGSFWQEVDPHFELEEQHLLPHLEGTASAGHVARTRAEHVALRALAAQLAGGAVEPLPRFAEALRAHIRYEERELWAAVETTLSPEELARLSELRPRERG